MPPKKNPLLDWDSIRADAHRHFWHPEHNQRRTVNKQRSEARRKQLQQEREGREQEILAVERLKKVLVIKTLPSVRIAQLEDLLALWLDSSLYLGGDLEEKVPILKKARTLTAYYFEKKGTINATKTHKK